MTRYTEQFPTGPYGRHPHPMQQAPAPLADRVARLDSAKRTHNTRRSRSRTVVMPLVIGIALLVAVVAPALYFADRYHWIDLSGLRFESDSTGARSAAKTTTIFSGRASELSGTQGNTIQEDPSDPSLVWIRSAVKAARSNGATDGVSIKVPGPLSAQILAKRIRVTVSARGSGGSSPFAVAYSTGSSGNSGWFVFEPTNQFKDFSFGYVVPRGAAGLNHFVGIWSDISGRGAPLAIRRVTITAEP